MQVADRAKSEYLKVSSLYNYSLYYIKLAVT